jgi:hypothetical protein
MVRKPYNFNGLGAPKCNNLALYVEEAIYPVTFISHNSSSTIYPIIYMFNKFIFQLVLLRVEEAKYPVTFILQK